MCILYYLLSIIIAQFNKNFYTPVADFKTNIAFLKISVCNFDTAFKSWRNLRNGVMHQLYIFFR